MKNYGFVRVAAASPIVKIADCEFNTDTIINIVDEAEKQSAAAVLFTENSLTAHTAADLFLQHTLLNSAVESLKRICEHSNKVSAIIIIGMPLEVDSQLYNVAVVIHQGKIKGIVPKTFIPNYNEFYEKRWFSPAAELNRSIVTLLGQEVPIGADIVFDTPTFSFAIEICEDLWTAIPPSCFHSLHGAEIIFNLSASNEVTGKTAYRRNLVAQQSSRCMGAYVYTSSGFGESTTDGVFSGHTIIAENGDVLSEGAKLCHENQLITADIDVDLIRHERLKNKSFSTLEYKGFFNLEYRHINIGSEDKVFDLDRAVERYPFIASGGASSSDYFKDILEIQAEGLAKRLTHAGVTKSVIGISGGLDSTLALLSVVKTYDKLGIGRDNIVGITMPGFGTTGRTYNNSIKLMEMLGITVKEISIAKSVLQHFEDIGHDPKVHDVTYENSQARERTQILMDYANRINGMVIGTGDLSELALGWCTYNGDHMAMYGVNAGIPKTLVQAVVKWASENYGDAELQAILSDVVNTPVSPELLPTIENGEVGQITEDLVGPYMLHDFFLYYALKYGFTPSKIFYLARYAFKEEFSDKEILKWMKVFFRRFFTQQFKRSCMPDGPKVVSVSLSPRANWRMPSDASFAAWMKEIEALER